MCKCCGELFLTNRNKPILYEFDDGLRPNWYNGKMVS